MQNSKCRHCGTEMEASDMVNLARGYPLLGSIRDNLPFKKPKPYYLQFLKCPNCGYTELFFS